MWLRSPHAHMTYFFYIDMIHTSFFDNKPLFYLDIGRIPTIVYLILHFNFLGVLSPRAIEFFSAMGYLNNRLFQLQ